MADQSSDEAEILELIHRDRIAIWTGDFDAWKACFVHAPYTARWGWWRTGGVFARTGWDELSKRVGKDPIPSRTDNAYDTKVTNLKLQVHGDMAWATYNQEYPSYFLPGHAGPGYVHEMRVFERHEGAWKIAFMGFLDGSSGPQGVRTVRLDVDARIMWRSPAAGEALSESDDLVVRNGHLRFRDHRADRRLRESLRWVAEQDAGLMSTRAAKPIVIDAGPEEVPHVYWVALDAGMLFLISADSRVSEERMEFAAAVYGLSATQARLAALIAEGLTLTEIAARLSISPHTARTHLQRIFDKTGVHSQSALVRVLLTAVAPI